MREPDDVTTGRTLPRNSSDMPSMHMLMLYFAMVYAVPVAANQAGFMFIGGPKFRTWALNLDSNKCGRALNGGGVGQ